MMTARTISEEHQLQSDRTSEPAGPPVDANGAPAADGIFVYGADWCGDTLRSRALLDRLGIPYTAVDVDTHAAASAWAAAQNGGLRRIPVVVLPHAADLAPAVLLIEPSDDDLLAALRRTGYLVTGAAYPHRTARVAGGARDTAS
jgi:mycoredoxin